VLELTGDGRDVLVQAGIMKINVNIKDLRIVSKNETKKEKSKPITAMIIEKSRSISPELDLRGYNGEEAIKTIEKYIDDAVLVGLGQLSLIHGKGTGALAKAVQGYLKTHPQVKDFRYGQHGEGGHGVTIVKL